MNISVRARFWRFFVRMMFKNKHMNIEEYRVFSLRNARRMNHIPDDVEMKRFHIEHIPAAWLVPSEAKKDKVILHLHGGGYVLGGIEGHQMMCILMAQTLKMNVFLPEYRLAPENPFPAAVEDTVQVYQWLLSKTS